MENAWDKIEGFMSFGFRRPQMFQPDLNTISFVQELRFQVFELKNEIERLKSEQPVMLKVDDVAARCEIESFLAELKNNGIERVNILDIMAKLKLPSDQIERVMKSLRKSGVKEV
jgi:hypothetical protein